MQQQYYIRLKNDNQKPNAKQLNKINQQNVSICRDNDYCVGRGSWSVFKIFDACALLSQWKAISLSIYFNRYNQILMDIANIRFPFLKELNLRGNNITSIEVISTIWLPQLQNLQLYDNRIQKVQALKKVEWPKIKRIQLRDNFVLDGWEMGSMRSGGLQKLVLDEHDDEQQCSDFRWILKIEAAKLTNMCIQSQQRISQFSVERTLLHKYPQVQIQTFCKIQETDNLLEIRYQQQIQKLLKK